MSTTTSPYIPSFLKAAIQNARPIQLTFSEISDTNIKSTSSFLYDPTTTPLKNTQQLNVDWSKFENHTFFSSAEAKVNTAFETIINGYPFDGTKAEIETFFENMTGFDRWVFDSMPKYKGQLLFSGSWIVTADKTGYLYPEISKNDVGQNVLNPRDGKSLSLEMQIFVPREQNANQVLCQKMSGSTQGFSLHLMQTSSTSSAWARFCVISGSNSMTCSGTLVKGQFNHICVSLNRDSSNHRAQFYTDATLVDESATTFLLNNDLTIDGSDFLIGSGTAIIISSGTFTPTQTLSGSMDELRVFHSTRTIQQQQLFAKKTVYATPELVLYYRFNEPTDIGLTSSDGINSIVLDSSGNSLHATITNFVSPLRQDASEDTTNPMAYEKIETTTVLFPAYSQTTDFNAELMASATLYDKHNPNLITRLIPQHYLIEGAQHDGFNEINGTLDENMSTLSEGAPGHGKFGNVQIMLTFLYIWSRFFDELKLYVDSFSSINYVNYNIYDTTPNNFLFNIVKQLGFNLPPLFNDSTIDQYINAENIGQEVATSAFPLKHVQNELMRRVLINMPGVLRSKGTQHSIKSFLRAIGIDPDNSLRIREFGGPTTKQLSFSRETKREPNVMIKFISSSFVSSSLLSGTRVEPGFPRPLGPVNTMGTSSNSADGHWTSGSWTIEGIYKFAPTLSLTSATQSLARLEVLDQQITPAHGLVANMLLISASAPRVLAYFRPGMSAQSPTLKLELTLPSGSAFDGHRWNFSMGSTRGDQVSIPVSSSYFLRASTQTNGEIETFLTTASYFFEQHANEGNILRGQAANTGSFIALGSNETISQPALAYYLNATASVHPEARTTQFLGYVSNFRFWSKALTDIEWREHVRNYKSLGVSDPLTNYNFNRTSSGSFERVRMDTMGKQPIRRANASSSLGPTGSITFLDFSLNNTHMYGSGFPIDEDCLVGEYFDYSYLSPIFDEASTNDKVRVRGFQNLDLLTDAPWAGIAPINEIVKSEEPTDDTRLSIEFSLIDALNRDIVTMFATFDSLDNALGAPELMFSPDYPDLEKLRNIYFNRLSSKLNFRDFFEFFRWFDTTIGTFIEQLVPRKTRFKGTNFVIESHMLERAKLEYLTNEIYLIDRDKTRVNDTLLVQLVVGSIRKY